MSSPSYDVIVIGAGISGLMCGNFLARSGRRVLMLEHSYQAGGLMTGFKRKGHYFDGGDQSFENIGILFPMLKELGLYDPQDWTRTHYSLKTSKFDFQADTFEEIQRSLIAAHPQDEAGIRSFIRELTKAANRWRKLFQEGTIPYAKSGWLYNSKAFLIFFAKFVLNRDGYILLSNANREFSDFVHKHLKDPELQALFSGIGYENWNEAFGNLFWYLWQDDYWYPYHGIQHFLNSLVNNFKKLGGDIRFRHTVNRLLIEKGKIIGVESQKGTFYGKKVVYCADMKKLYTTLIDPKFQRPNWHQSMQNATLSEPFLTAYLGLDMSHEELSNYLKTHHTFYMPTYTIKDVCSESTTRDPDLHKNTWLEVTWTSKENPKLAPEGKSTVILQTMSNYRWQNYWETGGDDFARPPAYKVLKEKVLNQMIDTFSDLVPHVHDKIRYKDLGTPQSLIRFTLNSEGATSSWSWDRKKVPCGRRYPKLRTPIRNLYTAGHYTIWPGSVPLAALSGKIVADRIKSGFYSETTDYIYQWLQRLRK